MTAGQTQGHRIPRRGIGRRTGAGDKGHAVSLQVDMQHGAVAFPQPAVQDIGGRFKTRELEMRRPGKMLRLSPAGSAGRKAQERAQNEHDKPYEHIRGRVFAERLVFEARQRAEQADV